MSRKESCDGVHELLPVGGSERYEVHSDEVGADCGEGPPVPFPNTAVKLTRAHDTWLATAWENR